MGIPALLTTLRLNNVAEILFFAVDETLGMQSLSGLLVRTIDTTFTYNAVIVPDHEVDWYVWGSRFNWSSSHAAIDGVVFNLISIIGRD